jgi:hypothetical protein
MAKLSVTFSAFPLVGLKLSRDCYVIPIPSDGVICETGRPKLVNGVGIYDAIGANWYQNRQEPDNPPSHQGTPALGLPQG